MRATEPCLCGDPLCPRCFVQPGPFTRAYIECLLWAESGDPGSPLGETANIEELSTEAWERIHTDCDGFLDDAKIAALVNELGAEQCGHDFWLTRNHHGAGFWDRGYSESEEAALMAQCAKFRELDAYRGDDGMIYLA